MQQSNRRMRRRRDSMPPPSCIAVLLAALVAVVVMPGAVDGFSSCSSSSSNLYHEKVFRKSWAGGGGTGDMSIHRRGNPETLWSSSSSIRRPWSSSTRTTMLSSTQRPTNNEKDASSSEATSSSTATTTLPSSSSSFAFDSARAGEGGYSVLRQPLSETSWNPEADPQFAIPNALDDKDESNTQRLDDSWWSSKQQQQTQTRQQPPSKPQQEGGNTQQNESSFSASKTIGGDTLDLFQRSLDTLDYPRVLDALYDECSTLPAKRLVRQAAQTLTSSTSSSAPSKRQRQSSPHAYAPLVADTVEGAQARYGAVHEMTVLLESRHAVLDQATYRNAQGRKQDVAGRPPPLAGNTLVVLETLAEAAQQGRVLEGPDLFDISNTLTVLENLVRWSQALEEVGRSATQDDSENSRSNPSSLPSFVHLVQITREIQVNATLQDLLVQAFDKQPQPDGSPRLSGTTFAAVGRLRARVRSLKADILSSLERLVALPSLKSKLALESGGPLISEISGGRLVVPVDQKYAASLGIVHDTSRSGKTAYVELTDVVGPTNELRQAQGELRAEEARVWRLLTLEILQNQDTLETSLYAAGQLDLVLARVLLGRRLQGTIPVVQDEGVICVQNAKHPVLLLREMVDVVGSDVDLGAHGKQGLVLTGPNSGGKTIILKLLGLLALLARAGIPVPANPAMAQDDEDYDRDDDPSKPAAMQQGPRVDFFNPILADIGDIQSVGGDLSTFSGHILVCREVLANSGKNALVLMDEVGSGTDPAQGVAIAQALLEALVETGARVAITTHYMQLKQLAASDDRFSVGGMQFVQGRPTYRLLPGTVGESFALAVAERLELPRAVLDRANALLDSETRQMGDLIRELEDQKSRVEEQAVEMETKRKELATLELNMREEQMRLEKKQLVVRRQEAKKFAQKLEEKERIMEDILEKLKSDPSRRLIAKSWEDIRFVKRDALNEAENVPSVLARKEKAAAMMEEAQAEMVPIAELRDKPELKEGDSVVICKAGPLFGREASVVKAMGNRVEVRSNNMNISLKLT